MSRHVALSTTTLESDRLTRLAERGIPTDGDRESLAVTTPFTGEALGSVPVCTGSDVEAAVERARTAQERWATRTLAERRAVLLAFHDLVLSRQDELLDAMQLESGKARLHAFEEVLDVAINSRYYANVAQDVLAPEPRQGAFPLLTSTEVRHHPLGVVGIIAPWNYPLTLAVSDAIPALVAGNAVVLKPDAQTPFTALLAVELLREAGLPRDLFQVVTGPGADVGPPLISNVDFVGFTGSTETGRLVASQAGEQLVECSLELGGKNPMLVFDDADLDAAVEGAIRGCFTNAGQLCISFERLYVHRDVYDAFLDAFTARTRELVLGADLDYGPDVGSLVSESQLATVEAHVADAVEQGATVETGGRARPDLGPYFYEPTVLTDVTPAMRVATEETFGPVVSVVPFDDAGEAIDLANDSPYGLNASVWTADADFGRELATHVDCGTVNVNEAYAATWASVDAPMGGMKQSGLGRRHGPEGLSKYTESQTISVQRGAAIAPPPGVPDRWYARLMTGSLRLLKRLPGVR